MILWPRQAAAKEMLINSLRSGKRRPVIAGPTSFGKTVLAANLMKGCQDKGKKGVFFCDRNRLLKQTISKFKDEEIDFGVIQADNELTDPSKPIQIASIATVARRSRLLEFDFAIVDECHITYEVIKTMMAQYNAVPFVGLSATPYSKGMGKYWDDLIVPCTQRQLISEGLLCPVNYYAGHSIDTSKVTSQSLRTGGTDFSEKGLREETEKDKTLTGDIIKNWIKHGEGKPTIAFSPSIKHSKWLAEQFNLSGIPAVHIDGYMDEDLKDSIYYSHECGDFTVLCCSRLLNTGYDAPYVCNLIDCFPTKSIIAWVQRVGRIMRTMDGKEYANYLDHAGNLERFGMFAEDIIPERLDDGEKQFSEKNQIKEKKKSEPKECPQCSQQMIGLSCKCGYEVPVHKAMEQTPEILSRVIDITKDKSRFYSEVMAYAALKGKSDGWAAHIYKHKFKEWPDRKLLRSVSGVSDDTMKYIKWRQIAYAKSNKRAG